MAEASGFQFAAGVDGGLPHSTELDAGAMRRARCGESEGDGAGALQLRREAEARASFSWMAKAVNTGAANVVSVSPSTPLALAASSVIGSAGSVSSLAQSPPPTSQSLACSLPLSSGSLATGITDVGAEARLESSRVESTCKALISTNSLIQAIQAERGSSSMYLASFARLMADKLESYRASTDRRYQAYKKSLEPGPGISQELSQLRSAVDLRSQSYSDAVTGYSRIVDALLDELTVISQPLRSSILGPSVASLLLLERFKECAALQRGIVAGVLATGVLQMDWSIYLLLVKILAKMEALSSSFQLLADPETISLFNECEVPPLVQEFQDKLLVSKEMIEGMVITTSPDEWFKQNSERMEQLAGLHKHLVVTIQTAARQICHDDELVLSVCSSGPRSSDGSTYDHNTADQTGTSKLRWNGSDLPLSSNLKKEWEISFDQLRLIHEVGSGATGTTHLATWDGSQVAVKVLASDGLVSDKSNLRNFLREISILSRLHHPNICTFYGTSMDPPRMCLVMEYMDKGSLWSKLRTNPTAQDFISTATQLVCALRYLHEMAQLVHRDIKTPNILLNGAGQVKISDFGMTCIGKAAEGNLVGAGTQRWMAPEVMLRNPHSFSSDMYSFGIVLWELVTKDVPFRMLEVESRRLSPTAPVRITEEHLRPTIPFSTPRCIANLIKQCLHPEPEERPTAGEALEVLKKAQLTLTAPDRLFLSGVHRMDECVPFASCWSPPESEEKEAP